MFSPNTTENVSSFLERTLEGSKILEIIRGNLSKATARRNVPLDVRTTPTPSDLKLQLYELGILSRHLLFFDSPDEKWSTRWVAALDKVAQAFATEIPLAQPDSDDNCVNYDRNIDEWIKTVVPEHVRIIRVVLKADNEHQKLLELVQSLQQIHQNLDTITRVFPGSQEVQRRQLKDLMLTLLSSLQEHQMDLEDTIPPGEASQLFALANFAAQSSYDDFSESFSLQDSSDASVIGPALMFAPAAAYQSNQFANQGDGRDATHAPTADVVTQPDLAPDHGNLHEDARYSPVSIERRASDAVSTSSVPSMVAHTPDSSSRPTSPRGSRRSSGISAGHRAGGIISTSTPVQEGRQRDSTRRTSGSSGASLSGISVSSIGFQLPPEAIAFYDKKIAEAVKKEQAERKREVELLTTQIEMVKEERKRLLDDLEVWKALAIERDADLRARDADLRSRDAELKNCIEELWKLRLEVEKAR
ncbi:hypothetical protein BN946_scf184980.g39 [Trametes cinnabarina]|uniref:Uncharacterized protein n=1 Tax=Pycnoporus cinnabarinus TaxID=5643 RepID=A0A060SJ80_PYCCI|nr:hypothetical protein BN946_scf184980.g39 [Trametes cinnabarina]